MSEDEFHSSIVRMLHVLSYPPQGYFDLFEHTCVKGNVENGGDLDCLHFQGPVS